jgi:hypothetical protein
VAGGLRSWAGRVHSDRPGGVGDDVAGEYHPGPGASLRVMGTAFATGQAAGVAAAVARDADVDAATVRRNSTDKARGFRAAAVWPRRWQSNAESSRTAQAPTAQPDPFALELPGGVELAECHAPGRLKRWRYDVGVVA